MPRKLIVSLPRITAQQRGAIASAAARQSFEALFFSSNADALPHLNDAEIIFGVGTELTRSAPRLRWFCTPYAGVEPYLADDVFASEQVILSNSSGAYGTTIAEHIVMVTLELMRRRQEYAAIVARRAWTRDLRIHAIRNSRITLLGTGDIGREAAIRLRAFSPAALIGVNRSGKNPGQLFDRVVTRDQIDGLLPETDVLILSLPSTRETDGLISAARLALLPRNAYVINVGRGNAIDQAALEAMLRSDRLAGAALDVFDQEPLPADSTLWDCPRLIVTPHVAGNITLDYTLEKIVALFLEDFENYCAGRPLLRQVDRTIGY
ncbi:MAG: D-2-hydroxyacid dehydrogenase [Clostridia bacterium]|nr:D-2-hydroxyacid dehydrogenase [Clostridia bacterium]MBR1585460.1 D-2-hydroxyacid dehydrogenase [Clostridia bacterium]